jgi:hypothetical protein
VGQRNSGSCANARSRPPPPRWWTSATTAPDATAAPGPPPVAVEPAPVDIEGLPRYAVAHVSASQNSRAVDSCTDLLRIIATRFVDLTSIGSERTLVFLNQSTYRIQAGDPITLCYGHTPKVTDRARVSAVRRAVGVMRVPMSLTGDAQAAAPLCRYSYELHGVLYCSGVDVAAVVQPG